MPVGLHSLTGDLGCHKTRYLVRLHLRGLGLTLFLRTGHTRSAAHPEVANTCWVNPELAALPAVPLHTQNEGLATDGSYFMVNETLCIREEMAANMHALPAFRTQSRRDTFSLSQRWSMKDAKRV